MGISSLWQISSKASPQRYGIRNFFGINGSARVSPMFKMATGFWAFTAAFTNEKALKTCTEEPMTSKASASYWAVWARSLMDVSKAPPKKTTRGFQTPPQLQEGTWNPSKLRTWSWASPSARRSITAWGGRNSDIHSEFTSSNSSLIVGTWSGSGTT